MEYKRAKVVGSCSCGCLEKYIGEIVTLVTTPYENFYRLDNSYLDNNLYDEICFKIIDEQLTLEDYL